MLHLAIFSEKGKDSIISYNNACMFSNKCYPLKYKYQNKINKLHSRARGLFKI